MSLSLKMQSDHWILQNDLYSLLKRDEFSIEHTDWKDNVEENIYFPF